jgi:hypothetical protein
MAVREAKRDWNSSPARTVVVTPAGVRKDPATSFGIETLNSPGVGVVSTGAALELCA